MSDLVSSSRVPTGVPECFRGRLSKRLSVSGGKPSQLVEPVPGRDGGDRRRPCTGIVEGAPDALQPRGEQAPRRAHPAHAVEGIAKAAFAETGDPTEGVKRCGSIRMRADVGFGAFDSHAPGGDCPLAPLPNRMTRLHAWQGTSARKAGALSDLPDRTGKTNREAAVFLPDPRRSGERPQWRARLNPRREHPRPVSRRSVRRAREGRLAAEVLRTRAHEPWFRARVR